MISIGNGMVELITGPMFSGKSEELIRRLRRAQIARIPIQVFNHRVDSRYSTEHIVSHSEWRFPSLVVERADEILDRLQPGIEVVGIDEAQFFCERLVEVAGLLADRGVRVLLAGLNLNYLGRPFGPMPELLALADHITKLSAICASCGSEAHFTHRIIPLEDHILVGAGDLYEARCRKCFLAVKPLEVV